MAVFQIRSVAQGIFNADLLAGSISRKIVVQAFNLERAAASQLENRDRGAKNEQNTDGCVNKFHRWSLGRATVQINTATQTEGAAC